MLESLPAVLFIGTLLGFLSGLGIGGGSLLILWLTVVLNTEQSTARIINLLFFIPSAVIACMLRRKQGTLTFKPLLPAVIPGCVAAAFSSWLSGYLDVAVLKKIFGFILIAAGLRELFFRKKIQGG